MFRPDTFRLTVAILALLVVPAVGLGGDDEDSGAASAGGGFFEDRVETVTSARVQIGYEVLPDGDPVTKVELWYTQDRGKAWMAAEQVMPDVNPIVFEAPADGVYGFFLVLHNRWASTPKPVSGVAPPP